MNSLLCDSGPLIGSFNPGDPAHERCTLLLAEWTGKLLIPEPVLGETSNYLRNHVRNGAQLEARLLQTKVDEAGDFEIIDPTRDDRVRAAEIAEKFVDAPFGYVDAVIVAMAERLSVANIATVDFKFLGMASSVSKLKPLNFVLQES